jgi:hypothetical protein
MTQPEATCPNCGAKVTFAWSSSVQTTCAFCKSILVRTDVDLKKVGQVADLPPNSSPIQLGTEGIYDSKAFHVIGRIIYEYEFGTWNEWHVLTNDGRSMWLSDAQDEYAVTFAAEGRQIPSKVKLGQSYTWDGIHYQVTSITEAHYRGVEGELPFEYWDADDVSFADLKSADSHFATIDYSDESPALYLGRMVEFDDLHMKNLRSFEGWS